MLVVSVDADGWRRGVAACRNDHLARDSCRDRYEATESVKGITDRVNIIGVGVSAINMEIALETFERWIAKREGHYVCVCAVHLVMECRRDAGLRRIVNAAGLVTPDGMPLVWTSRLRGHPQVQRVYGPDLMLAFCKLAAQRGYSAYLFGGAPGQPEQVAESLIARFPGLRIVGTHATPLRPLPAEDNTRAVAEINEARPDVVWVGLGAPLQERWMAENRSRLDAPVLVGVGAAFDFHSGRVRQAPAWMQRSGLEWLYRLSRDPKRLWRRYLVLNPLFVFHLTLQQLRLRRFDIE